MFFFFFQAEDGIRDVAVTGVQTCALPILDARHRLDRRRRRLAVQPERMDDPEGAVTGEPPREPERVEAAAVDVAVEEEERDRKSTRLNSSHGYISYAVFCLKKKKNNDALTHHLA